MNSVYPQGLREATPGWVIALMGPTASGKTALALELVESLPVEIVSVDSALVYRGLDIGTAKPSRALLHEVPHHLIDIRDPADAYSAADFRADALQCIHAIQARGKVPLLVGGTMLYYKFLFEGSAELPAADAEVRQRLEDWAQQEGWQGIHRRLAEVDPESATRIHPNDPQRLQRALEIYLVTGKSMTWHLQRQRFERQRQEQQCQKQQCQKQQCQKQQQCECRSVAKPFELLQVAVCPSDRGLLHKRIAERFLKMLDEGLIEETQALLQRGDLHEQLPSMRSVGYRQVCAHLMGCMSYAEMVDRGIIATRQLAKRQMTWLRRWPNVEWFHTEDPLLSSRVLQRLKATPIFL